MHEKTKCVIIHLRSHSLDPISAHTPPSTISNTSTDK